MGGPGGSATSVRATSVHTTSVHATAGWVETLKHRTWFELVFLSQALERPFFSTLFLDPLSYFICSFMYLFIVFIYLFLFFSSH